MSKGKQIRGRPHMRWMEEIKGTTKLTMDELRNNKRHDCLETAHLGCQQKSCDLTGHHIKPQKQQNVQTSSHLDLTSESVWPYKV